MSKAINLLIFVLLCSLIILLFNRYVLHGNLNYLISFLEKYISNKYIPTLKGQINKGMNYNNKFIFFIFTINGILLLILLFLNIYVTAELVVNIDSYVNVYNLIHSKKSIICIISMSRLIKSNCYVYPNLLNNKQHIRFYSRLPKGHNSNTIVNKDNISNSAPETDSYTIIDNLPDLNYISENSIYSSIQDFINQYNQFLSTLTPEQLACLFNSLSLILITFNINSILAIFFGNKLIIYLKIEERFPKIQKWIEYRRQFRNYFLIYNFFIIYLVIFLTICINILMFFL